MKTYTYEPTSRIFYAIRTTAILGTLGFFVAAGLLVIGAEKAITWGQRWYGEFFKERELP